MLHTEHITVMSLKEAEEEIDLLRLRYIVISIMDPDGDPAGEGGSIADVGVVGKDGCVGILRLWFHDTEDPRDPIWVFPEQDHAKMIVQFIEDHKEDLMSGQLHLFVHCLAGKSRSAATAAAISMHLFHTDEVFFKVLWPNTLLYNLILQEWSREQV